MPTNDIFKQKFSQNLIKIMKDNNINQTNLSKALGVSESTVGKWILCKAFPRMNVIQKLSDYFGVEKTFFFEDSLCQDNGPLRQMNLIPLLSHITENVADSNIQNILGYEAISKDLSLTGKLFALRIKDTSMEPTFTKGDIIIVKQQPYIKSNDIALLLINRDEEIIRRIKKDDKGIVLISDNSLTFAPQYYSNDEIVSLPVKVVGKVVELRRSF